MKNNPTFLLCLLVLLAGTQFQVNAQSNNCLTYGLKVGGTYGTPIGPAEEGASGRPGLGPVLGLFASYNFTPKWGMQTELYYTQKKAKFSTPVTDKPYSYAYNPRTNPDTTVFIPTKFNGTITGSFNNKYLELPVMGYYQTGENFRILLGPYIAYLISPENTGTATGNVGWGNLPVENEPFDESYNINKFDVGLAGGFRFDTKYGIICEFKITGGMLSVYKPSYTLQEEAVRNIYLQLSAGYRIQSLCRNPRPEKQMLGEG